MIIGYARVSTDDQNLGLQLTALKEAGCEKIYQEKESGKNTERPELQRMLEHLREGDIVVVWKLDRLGRSLIDLIELINGFHRKHIQFRSMKESIDTTTATGKLIFNIFASIAEFEREMIRERVMAGLEEAKRLGRTGGRPKGLSKEARKKAALVQTLTAKGVYTVSRICKEAGVSRTNYYRYLKIEL